MQNHKKKQLLQLRRWRIRKKISGSGLRPRMAVKFSNEHIYVQFIDDTKGVTLASASTRHQSTPGREQLAANVESASYGLTCCAERVALFRALSSGEKRFTAIAVTARLDGGAMPCGACRQLLAEYAPDAVVWVSDCARPREIKEYTVDELLPGAFRKFRGDLA